MNIIKIHCKSTIPNQNEVPTIYNKINQADVNNPYVQLVLHTNKQGLFTYAIYFI